MYLLNFDDSELGKDTSSFMLDRISPSMIGTYKNCPLAFYYQYIAKLQLPQKNIHLEFGSAIHKALELLYVDEKADVFDVFKEEFKKENLDDESKLMHSEYFMLGLEMVKNYIEIRDKLDLRYSLNTGRSELRLKTPIVNPVTGETLRIPVSGVMDKLTGDNDSHKIVEYKTSKTKWRPDEERFKLQSRLYNLLYYYEHGKPADETVYIILLKKYKKTARDEVIQVLTYQPTLDDLAEMYSEVDAILDKVEAGEFSRPTKGHPPYCDCYAYEKMLNLKA
jgi:RecB family exonuclease